jgi:hypothetical protein
MKFIYFLLLNLCFCSCVNDGNNIPVYKYALETIKVENYILNTKNFDSILYFAYENTKDSIVGYDLNFEVQNKQLELESRIFLPTVENYLDDGYNFKIYQRKDVDNDIRTLVFDQNYGLLASLRFGENFIFSKDSLSAQIKELTFKKIFRSVNNIKIE